ncbi:hypothetical protein Efla_007025 [Eimeria flavescens]
MGNYSCGPCSVWPHAVTESQEACEQGLRGLLLEWSSEIRRNRCKQHIHAYCYDFSHTTLTGQRVTGSGVVGAGSADFNEPYSPLFLGFFPILSSLLPIFSPTVHQSTLDFFPETSTEVPGAAHAVLPPTTEDPPARQPQGRPSATFGGRGQPQVTSKPTRLLSTKHQQPVRQPIALTGSALPDFAHNPCVEEAKPTLVQQQPVVETESSCSDVPGVPGSVHTFQQTAGRFQKSFDFSRKHAFEAVNVEKEQQEEI